MAEIGSTLREARMHAHIDITEVEARTKIRAKYLRALEDEEWELLPGSVYVKSFLRTYADFLGLDSRLLLDEFKRSYELPDERDVRSLHVTGRERDLRRARGGSMRGSNGRGPSGRGGVPERGSRSPRVLIGLAVLVIIAGLYVLGTNTGNNAPHGPGNVTPAQGALDGSVGGRHNAPAGHGHGSGGGVGGSVRDGQGGGHGGHHHGTGPGSLRGSSRPGQSGGGRHTRTGRAGTKTGKTHPKGAARTPADATLAVVPSGPVWICVEGANGAPVFAPGTFQAGQTIPAARGKKLLVTIGSTSVTLTVNGKSYPAPATAPVGLQITPRGVKPLPSLPTCGQ